MKRVLLAVVLVPATLFADDVILKSGGRVSGRIVQRTDAAVKVDVGAGTITIAMDRVERIEEKGSALDDYYDRAGRLAASDTAGWLELARWASSEGLSAQAGEAYHRVLAADPANAEANQALGNVQQGGRWVSEAESYRERGYVQFEGEWMTPAQRDALVGSRRAQTDADARQAQSEAEARSAQTQADAAEDEETDEGIPLWWGTWGPSAQPGRPAHQPARGPR